MQLYRSCLFVACVALLSGYCCLICQAGDSRPRRSSIYDEIECGTHVSHESPIAAKFNLPRYTPQMLGKPFECTSEFEAGDSMYVDVQVLELRMPSTYYNERTKNCTGGFLKIFDGTKVQQQWAPTELCGVYDRGIAVRRFTSFSSAKLVFKVANLVNTTAIQVKVKFVNIDTNIEYRYGNYFDVDGRVKIKGRRICDWNIPVNQRCQLKSCDITTPGFPGIYPPFASCIYRLINNDNGRVHLQLGGGQFIGKFNMRKSERCEADYVNVYDGDGVKTQIVGTYCGNDGVEVISSGNALTVEFVSAAGGPPWDYTGFDGRVISRTVEEPQASKKKPRSTCSWDFDSASDERQGVVYTPDYFLPDHQTTCIFTFMIRDGDMVDLDIAISHVSANCEETLEVQDGWRRDTKELCEQQTASRTKRQRLLYNSTGPILTVRYTKPERQLFNANPISIRYVFRRRIIVGSRRPPIPSSLRTGSSPAPAALVIKASASSTSQGRADATLPIVSASTVALLLLLAIVCCHR